MTGVTIVTTIDDTGQPRGFTAELLHVGFARPAASPDLHRKKGGKLRHFLASSGLCRKHPVREPEDDVRHLRLKAAR